MRLILSVFIILISSFTVFAQEVEQGLYEAENLDVFNYVGSGWTQVIDGDYVVMESVEIDDSVSLEFNGGSIIIFRSLHAISGAMIEACIDSDCSTFSNAAAIDMARIPIAFSVSGTSPHSMTLTNLDGNFFQFDNVIVLPDDELQSISAPDPSKQFFALDGGRVVSVDFSISGGDIAAIIFLAFNATVLFALFVTVRSND